MIDVRSLLKSKGVRFREPIEEYTDHFCSLYEEYEETHGAAKAEIYTRVAINRVDHKQINRDYFNLHYKNKLIMLSSVITLFCILFTVQFTFDPPTISPIEISKAHISSNFGMVKHPLTKESKMHKGIDLKAAYGEEVKTTADGVVIEAAYDDKMGYYVVIEHDEHFTTRYYHLSKIEVEKNNRVKVGDVIGKVGATGLATAPHLHYEVLQDGKHVDPIKYLKS